MKLVLPMAGRGQRFIDGGFETPKPLVSVAGKAMVLHALDSVKDIPMDQLIVICLASVEKEYGVSTLIRSYVKAKTEFVFIDAVTEGQLCTVLTARALLPTEEDVLIMASDSFIVSNLASDIANRKANCDGLISVASLPGDQWSFAKTDPTGRVEKVAEKVRISGNASTGLYYFTRAGDLLKFGDDMIRNNERTRGEFYVIPVYEKMINAGKNIFVSQATEMWDMGTPRAKLDFEDFLAGKGNK